ncbi:hypothetical protein [Streptomyces calidiresistens]|uniref:hypothetical protein n=1 Tax=Streptomyces calidiresistens TaxID=1485586 RepID=UPI001E473CD6|nr:hypothetical protein [Streptomyces calidiresistens]
MSAPTRKSIPITEEDQSIATRIRDTDSSERAALLALGVELSSRPSEAEVLHALLTAGRKAVEEGAMLHGYAALAAQEDEEDREFHAAMRGRRRGAGEEEA